MQESNFLQRFGRLMTSLEGTSLTIEDKKLLSNIWHLFYVSEAQLICFEHKMQVEWDQIIKNQRYTDRYSVWTNAKNTECTGILPNGISRIAWMFLTTNLWVSIDIMQQFQISFTWFYWILHAISEIASINFEFSVALMYLTSNDLDLATSFNVKSHEIQ